MFCIGLQLTYSQNLSNETTEGTEQTWSHWAGGLIRKVQVSAVLSNRPLESGLKMKGGRSKQGSYWTGLTVPNLALTYN